MFPSNLSHLIFFSNALSNLDIEKDFKDEKKNKLEKKKADLFLET
jgi:hypothetical protein